MYVVTSSHLICSRSVGLIFFRRGPVDQPAGAGGEAGAGSSSKSAGGKSKAPAAQMEYDLESKINAAVFPALQGGPHMNTIAGIATALLEARLNTFSALSYLHTICACSSC